jgi:thymidylate kinase
MNQPTRQRLLQHFEKYPKGQIRDIFKYVYQSAFGCEHLVSSQDAALDYILREYAMLSDKSDDTIESLDGNYSRVPLSYLCKGLSPATLTKLFCRSAKKEPTGDADLHEKLQVARELVMEGQFSFSLRDFDAELDSWKQAGYPAVHHSKEFTASYHPAYRVISNEYVKLLPLLSQIDSLLQENGKATVAIEGGSASGKTTLSALLAELYGCTVFHMDDFFLRPEQRTPSRFEEIGGNVDHERFLEEVLLPIDRKEVVAYRRFDCATQSLLPAVNVPPTPLTVVEGAYSMHPTLAPHYDLSVFLDVPPACQRARILHRNTPAFAQRFFEEWIPLERTYFAATNVKSRCKIVIPIE